MAALAQPIGAVRASAPATVTAPQLRECRDCGQFQVIPAMGPSTTAHCLRCDAVLRHTRRDPTGVALALNLAALGLFAIGSTMSLMTVSKAGIIHSANLFSGPIGLDNNGLWELSLVVLITTVAAPFVKLASMTYVLIGVRQEAPPPHLRTVFAFIEHLRPWSMVEVYLLGVFVAYVKLSGLVHIDIGTALYALGLLMLVMVAADVALDRQAVWEKLAPPAPSGTATIVNRPTQGAIGCDTCGLVSVPLPGAADPRCPRCEFRLHHRKPNSLVRTASLSVAALILYLPANYYPVLTVIQLGAGAPSTILGGVRELMDVGMYPLAALVFFASITVPVVKLVGLAILLISTRTGYRRRLRDRTVLYRIVDAIGRWSMIDIFMESILVALVQFGAIVTIDPGIGAVAFAAVVILTMFAAQSFDPRLMWDAAERRARRPA